MDGRVRAEVSKRRGEGSESLRGLPLLRVLALVLRRRSALVAGGDGMGRTATLRALVGELRAASPDTLVVWLSRDALEGASGAAVALVALRRAIRARSAGADVMWDGVWEAVEGLVSADRIEQGEVETFLSLLREIEGAAEAVVVVIDDLLPTGTGESHPLAPWLARTLRRASEDPTLPPTVVVAAGSPELAASREQGDRMLVETMARVWLSPLGLDEVEQWAADISPDLDRADVEAAYRMVGGHPRLLRWLLEEYAGWVDTRGALDSGERVALARRVDADVTAIVEGAIGTLRRLGEGRLVDRLFEAARTGDAGAFTPDERVLLGTLGLVDANDRLPDRQRAVIARGAALAHGVRDAGDEERAGAPEHARRRDDGFLEQLGRKERLLLNYLRDRQGKAVSVDELTAAYFADDSEVLKDGERALRTVRAAVNRVNAKLAPSEAAAQANWKVIRYRRSDGFYIDREALTNLSH